MSFFDTLAIISFVLFIFSIVIWVLNMGTRNSLSQDKKVNLTFGLLSWLSFLVFLFVNPLSIFDIFDKGICSLFQLIQVVSLFCIFIFGFLFLINNRKKLTETTLGLILFSISSLSFFIAIISLIAIIANYPSSAHSYSGLGGIVILFQITILIFSLGSFMLFSVLNLIVKKASNATNIEEKTKSKHSPIKILFIGILGLIILLILYFLIFGLLLV